MNVSSPTDCRILFLITKANWGGAQKYVFDLALAAKDTGHKVAVAYGVPGALIERLSAAGIRSIPIQGLERDMRAKNDAASFFSLIRVLKEEKPDVVHLNSSKAGALGALAARIAGVPCIIFTAHGWAFNEQRPWWQKFVFRIIHAATIYLSHTTICVSDAVKRDVSMLPFVGKKLIVIKNGVSAPAFLERPAARATLLPTTTGGTWIGMLAELHPTKRIEDAIDALALIRKAHPDSHLVVLGEGSYRPVLEARIRAHGLESHVHLLGFVPDGARYLHAFDLFLLISKTEALAYALLEAGQASLPCIGTNVGGIPEVLIPEKTGLLVPVASPEAVARAITELLENPLKARTLGDALHQYVTKEFSQEGMVRKTLALYK